MTKVDFTGVRSTMLTTLYFRALDSRSPTPVLDDRIAADAVDRIEYDFESLLPRGSRGNRFVVALRARRFDEWTEDFLRRHPDATVLQLGCGMDSRAFRLDLPSGVRWYDVDFPDVIELRRRIYSEPEGYRMLSGSATDPELLAEIPADRPTLILAEGLLMYLAPAEVEALLRRLSDRFDRGELLFDGFAPWVLRAIRLIPERWLNGYPRYTWAVRDVQEIERWGYRFREDAPLMAEGAMVPVLGYRLVYKIMNAIPGARRTMRLFRYEFPR